MQESSQNPHPNHESVIRWYMNLIENLALSWHWGKTDQGEQIEEVLKHTVALLYAGGWGDERDPCPWPRCPDGICSPVCMGFTGNKASLRDFMDKATPCPEIPGKSF